jgi:hypothetical protein
MTFISTNLKTIFTKMAERQTITIKLKPWLQEFLICSLQDHGVASKRNVIGAMLTPFLEYAPVDYTYHFLEGEEFITFELPDHIAGKNPRSGSLVVSHENQKNFERMLDVYFKDLFYNYIDDKIRYNREIKKCIYQFCADYNLTFNNVSYEMLKKSYYRRRKQKKTEKSSAKMSLRCPLIFLM